MTPDKLPEEMQQEVIDNSLTYLASLYTDGYVKERYRAGTLHIPHEWKAIRKSHEAGATAWAPWKVKYDELQLKYDAVSVMLDTGAQNYDNLKAQAQAMADALEALLNMMPKGDSLRYFHAKEEVISGRQTLQQFKDGKGKEVEQNHNVSIGEWITYCKDCGFPVDECNCIDKETLS